jgi:hypothetical protein
VSHDIVAEELLNGAELTPQTDDINKTDKTDKADVAGPEE